MEKVKIKLCGGVIPAKAHPGDAAYDLILPADYKVSFGRQVIPLGFCMELPDGKVAIIKPRSGFSSRGVPALAMVVTGHTEHSFERRIDADVLDGVIDPTYRGEVGVILNSRVNWSDARVVIPMGTKIAQMLIVDAGSVSFEIAEDLSSSDRGEGGFGSTGAVVEKKPNKTSKKK